MRYDITEIDFYDGAASGQQKSALMRCQPSHVMLSFATRSNTPWDNRYHSRDEYQLFIDSGGFHHMAAGEGYYKRPDREYLDYLQEVEPELWALRDYPCEEGLLTDLGRTVDDQIQLTAYHHRRLLDIASQRDMPGKPVPVVQGYELDDYLRCLGLFDELGILDDTDYLGIGTLCRRGQDRRIAEIILGVRDAIGEGFDLHAFGVKRSVLKYREIVDAITSADSAAYDHSVSRGRGGRTPDEAFTWRDAAWAWLSWRRPLVRDIGVYSLDESPKQCNNALVQEIEIENNRIFAAIFEALIESPAPVSVKRIRTKTGLSQSKNTTISRVLNDLHKAGFLEHQKGSKYWHPTPKGEQLIADGGLLEGEEVRGGGD